MPKEIVNHSLGTRQDSPDVTYEYPVYEHGSVLHPQQFQGVEHAIGARLLDRIAYRDFLLDEKADQEALALANSSGRTLAVSDVAGSNTIKPRHIETMDRVVRSEFELVREKLHRIEDYLGDKFLTLLPDEVKKDYFEYVNRVTSKAERPQSYHEWVTEDSAEGNDRLVELLKYTVALNEYIQESPELVGAFNREKEEWVEGINRAVDEGWLHPDASHAPKKEQDLKVRFGDYFDLHDLQRGGYSSRHEPYISLPQSEQDIIHAGKHELNHALLGQLGDTWLDEALTEHIARALDGKSEVDVVDSRGSYGAERELLHSLLFIADGEVTLKDLTRLYSMGGPANNEVGHIEEKFNKVFNVENALSLINERILEVEKIFLSEGFPERMSTEFAVNTVRSDLFQQPDVVFGEQYVALAS